MQNGNSYKTTMSITKFSFRVALHLGLPGLKMSPLWRLFLWNSNEAEEIIWSIEYETSILYFLGQYYIKINYKFNALEMVGILRIMKMRTDLIHSFDIYWVCYTVLAFSDVFVESWENNNFWFIHSRSFRYTERNRGKFLE